MTLLPLSPSLLEAGLRWTARVLAISLVGFVVVIFIGTGGFNSFKLTPPEAILMTLFLTSSTGMVAGWRWQVLGGALSTAGMLLFLAVEFGLTGGFPKGPVFYLLLLPGVLFLLSAFVGRRLRLRGMH